ncbi:MAG: exodeoxyribonuclease VII large subunit [Peptoniphilaceae bacterium]|nr:exodeoxyribonuclease VII large subunit [Peptoniphilaceae bacterium]MDY3738179.1 exodeoxyribonuclease VII large subunit [Peptoniphilaceae bacterium]
MSNAISVKQFNSYIKVSFKQDLLLSRAYVKGEVVNLKKSHEHLYFSLKEDNEVINCVIFYFMDYDFSIEEGQEICVKGNLILYNFSSQIVINVNEIEELGLSDRFSEYIKIKEKYDKLGFFDEKLKKSIPDFPKKVGLITSEDGAAFNDFINIINSFPNDIEIFFYPIKVQGKDAISDSINALNILNNISLDVIVITRGGGSYEDLSIFNDENLLIKVHEVKTPVISAIGHQIDFTLVDFVADLRCQTPTDAANVIVRNYSNIRYEISNIYKQIRRSIRTKLSDSDTYLKNERVKMNLLSPIKYINDNISYINDIFSDIKLNLDYKINNTKTSLDLLNIRLKFIYKMINSKKKSIEVFDVTGKKMFSSNNIKVGSEIYIKFSDGKIKAKVIE